MRKPMYGVSVPTPRDPSPSPEDVQFTHQLERAADLLDLELLDHIVIGKGKFVSLKERGLGFGGGAEQYPTFPGDVDKGNKRKRLSPTSTPSHPSA